MNDHCFLLDLPVELISKIAERSSPVSRIILAQTCRPLYVALGNQETAGRLAVPDRLEFLELMIRDNPDEWICEVCMSTHRARKNDDPSKLGLSTCPRIWEQLRPRISQLRNRLNSPRYSHARPALPFAVAQPSAASSSGPGARRLPDSTRDREESTNEITMRGVAGHCGPGGLAQAGERSPDEEDPDGDDDDGKKPDDKGPGNTESNNDTSSSVSHLTKKCHKYEVTIGVTVWNMTLAHACQVEDT